MNATDPIRVSVTISVAIDPEVWALNYGVEGRAAIRADVKAYIDTIVREQLTEVGVLAGADA